MKYPEYKKAFRTWLIFLILFTMSSLWYIYQVIRYRDGTSLLFLIIYLVLIKFNYSRIKNMKAVVELKKREYKEEMLDNLGDEND